MTSDFDKHAPTYAA